MGSSSGEPTKSCEGSAGQHPPHHLRHDHGEDLDLVGDNDVDTSCRRPPTLMTTLGVASLYLLINVWGICVHVLEEINTDTWNKYKEMIQLLRSMMVFPT